MLCRSESSLEQLQFDVRLFDGYNGILQADEVTVDDITYEVLDQLYVLIITFINNLHIFLCINCIAPSCTESTLRSQFGTFILEVYIKMKCFITR